MSAIEPHLGGQWRKMDPVFGEHLAEQLVVAGGAAPWVDEKTTRERSFALVGVVVPALRGRSVVPLPQMEQLMTESAKDQARIPPEFVRVEGDVVFGSYLAPGGRV